MQNDRQVVCHLQHFVQTTRSQHCWVYDVRPISCSDNKHAAAIVQPVHLSQKLVDNAIASAAAIAIGSRTPACFADRIELVKKENAGR